MDSSDYLSYLMREVEVLRKRRLPLCAELSRSLILLKKEALAEGFHLTDAYDLAIQCTIEKGFQQQAIRRSDLKRRMDQKRKHKSGSNSR